MSASNDHSQQSEEENNSSDLNRSPLGEQYYDSFRQSLWTPGQFVRTPGHNSQRSSPGGIDLRTTRALFDNNTMVLRPLGTNEEYFSSLSPFQPSPNIDVSPHHPSNWPNRPAPDLSHPLRQRSSVDLHGWPSDIPSGNFPEGSHSALAESPPYRNIRRRSYNQDVFDGPSQLLPLPLPQEDQSRIQPLLQLPTSLSIDEQDEIARRANKTLSECAFHFVAKYQFPIPIERDRCRVRQASDREWTEWAYLLKKLATKRRIPARVLFEGQIKQFVTTLDNSIVVRQTTSPRNEQPPPPRTPRDDRYMLQLVSSGLQVAKIMKDSVAMEQLNQLYLQTETLIMERRSEMSNPRFEVGLGRPTRGTHGPVGRSVGRGIGIGGSVQQRRPGDGGGWGERS